MPLHTHWDGHDWEKKKKETSVEKDVEKLESSYVVGGNVKWYSSCGKQLEILKQVKHKITV